MNTCYDCAIPLKSRLIVLLIAIGACAAAAQPADTWHATVNAPRAGLPDVTVDLGYPGGYVPSKNTPVEMRATASDVAFDGYIGFHFGWKDTSTLDAPVLARVKLAPHQSWTFRTFATVRRWAGTPQDASQNPREFIVEWRNSNLGTIAQQNAGTPPWVYMSQMKKLFVAPMHGAADDYVLRSDQLSDRGQWYAGFADVVISLSSWLDLSKPVRDAIFGSGINVTFVGFARDGQQLDPATRALLPVTFTAQPCSYQLVWPYGAQSIATPVSWSAKPTVGFTGSAKCPSIARTTTASWVADKNALARPLPSVLRIADLPQTTWFGELSTTPRAGIVALIAFLVAVLTWWLVVKNRVAVAMVLLVMFGAGVLAAHDRIRAKATTVVHGMHRAMAPGVALDVRDLWGYGPTPLAPLNVNRLGLTGDYSVRNSVEVRTSDTAPSMGRLDGRGDWSLAIRWTMQRQLDDSIGLDSFVIPQVNDLHGEMYFYKLRPATSGRYLIRGDLQPLGDGRMQSTFALNPETIKPNANVSVHVSAVLAGGPIEIRWATGSARLTSSAPSMSRTPEAALPDAMLRAILDNGGIFDVIATVDSRVLQRSYQISVSVQEKKS